jgi:hypothetical protein
MIVAYHENRPVCAGFIYLSDSKIAWLEWVVADNEAEKAVRSIGIDTVLMGAKLAGQFLGAGAMFTSSKNQSLNKKLKEKFLESDSNMSHFIWRY